MDSKPAQEAARGAEPAVGPRSCRVVRLVPRTRVPTAPCHDSSYHQAAIDEAAGRRK